MAYPDSRVADISSYDPVILQYAGLTGGDIPMTPSFPGTINVPGARIPKVPGINPGALGFNLPTAQLAISGLGTLANVFAGFKSLSLANKQFKFQKNFANENLANQIKTYNTMLEDRSRSRAKVEGQTPEQAAAYIAANSLTRKPGG